MSGLMAVDIRSNVREVTRWLDATQKRQIPFATKQALNDVAWKLTKAKGAKSVLGLATDETFQKKSGAKGAERWTRTGFRFDKASKQDLTAWVYWDNKRGEYMEYQVFGGLEKPERQFRIAPHNTNMPSITNTFGTIKGSTVDKILADTGGKPTNKYFEGKPRGFPNAERGIWQRYGRTKKHPYGRRIRMVAAYTGPATYRPLFKFAETVEGFVFGREGFDRYFFQQLEKALRNQKARR